MACPPSANIRLYGSSIPHPKGKQRFYIFKYASRNPGIWAAKTPIKSGFLRNISFLCSFYGGEGEIRTLETLLTPTRFPVARPRPTRRLLQVIRVQSVLCCFHKQPLHNSMSDGKNQDIFQKKDEFFCFAAQGGKKGGIPALFIRCHVKFAVTHASPCLTSSPANGCSVPCPRQAA